MECISPISIKLGGDYEKNTKAIVPCGRCMACLSNKRSEWVTRLTHELSVSSSALFLTFTYNDENLKWASSSPTLCKNDFQSFMKNLRHFLERKLKYKHKLKYYCVGEYGELSSRPHYHAIMFNLPWTFEFTDVAKANLQRIWKMGNVDVGTVTQKSMNYVCKYVIMKNENLPDDVEKPFALISKGIGSVYVEKMYNWHNADYSRTYVPVGDGFRRRLPRYYRDKIYSIHARKHQFDDNQRRISELNAQRGGETISEFRNREESREHFERKTKRQLKGKPRDGAL